MATVADIQRRLISLGYNPGTADGILGPKTLSAIDAALGIETANNRELQAHLIKLGYDLGKSGADGIIGSRTLAAIYEALAKAGTVPTPPSTPKPATSSAATALVAKQAKATRRIDEIIVHCTATPEGRHVTVDTIRSWHVKDNGWSDIGYHYVVYLDGTIVAGRPEKTIGSHVAGHNTGTLGIVYVGGTDADGKKAKDTRTAAQTAALLDLAKALIAKYPAIKKITGHSQYANKSCPSFDVRQDPLGKLV